MRIVIAGAGIGGLTAALSLQAAGFRQVTLLESAREIQQVGVGINLPPHAVRELVELGLGEALDRAGLPTAELAYYDTRGAPIWAEPRGLDAGYRWPQYSIHRGKLQQLLLDATLERLGPGAVLTGQRVCAVERVGNGVRVRTADTRGDAQSTHDADLLVGADGIRSAVRASLYPDLKLATNGWTMFRGAAHGTPFLTGRSMVIVGDDRQRAVVYPLDAQTLNWLIVRPAPVDAPPLELGNWNRPASPQAVAEHVKDWSFDWLDLPALVRATDSAYEYPMADIDPLPQWTFDRVTLLGDAAHAMYPFGSNGASQAILDGRVLAYQLGTHANVDDALAAYEAARRPAVSAVQLANRRQAGDVMERVSALARAHDHAGAAAQLQQVEQQYKRLAGFDVETLNQRPSFSVPRSDGSDG